MTLGYPSAEALQEDMTSRQFAELLAFQRVEPLGQAREDLRFAILTAAVLNQMLSRGDPLVSPQDILDDYYDFWPELVPDAPLTEEEIAEQEDNLIQLAGAMFGQENRV